MKWFYTLKNHVKGPFSTEDFETALLSLGSDIKDTLVWTRGKADWTEGERWTTADADKIQAQAQSSAVMSAIATQKPPEPKPVRAEVKPETKDSPTQKVEVAPKASKPSINAAPVITPQQAPKTRKPKTNTEVAATQINTQIADQPKPEDIIMPTDDEITKLLGASAMEVIESVKDKSEEKYKVQFNGIDQPPMTKAELIQFTANQDDPSMIMVYNKKMNDWKEIYTFPDVIEKLGLSRRQNRRVTVLANFKGTINNGPEINARLTTVSMGGFGLTDVFDLKIGDVVKGQISSPHFYTPLAVQGEVTYAGSHGNIGLKFVTISDEAQALVVDYIKKFGQGVKTEQS